MARIAAVLSVLSVPWIDHGRSRRVVFPSIARDHRKTVMDGCRGNEKVRLRKCVLGFAAFLHQEPPPEDDVFRDCKNPLIEHRPHLIGKPVVQFGAAAGCGKLNPKTNLCKGYHADVKLVQGLCGDEGHYL